MVLGVKNPPANARDSSSIPGSGRFPWRRAWQPTPVFLPGESHGQRSLVGYSPWGCCKESDSTDATEHTALLLEEESGGLPFKGIRDSNYILNKLSTTPSFFFFLILSLSPPLPLPSRLNHLKFLPYKFGYVSTFHNAY